MTPKEKAEQLTGKFVDETPLDVSIIDSVEVVNAKLLTDIRVARRCAIVAVDEILENHSFGEPIFEWLTCNADYWQEVREELEKQLVKS